jgi:hypothetical protein
MGLGQLRGAFGLMDAPRICPNQISIVVRAKSYVYDGGYSLGVMKKAGGVVNKHSNLIIE